MPNEKSVLSEASPLDWVEDESNRDTRHARNFLRHRILAPLAQRFGAVGFSSKSETRRRRDGSVWIQTPR